MNICTEIGIELPDGVEWMDDDTLELMIKHHRISAIDAYSALLERGWFMWIKEHDLTFDDGDKIAHRAWHYDYVWNFLVDDGWFDIAVDIKERVELEYGIRIIINGMEASVIDLEKWAGAEQ